MANIFIDLVIFSIHVIFFPQIKHVFIYMGLAHVMYTNFILLSQTYIETNVFL